MNFPQAKMRMRIPAAVWLVLLAVAGQLMAQSAPPRRPTNAIKYADGITHLAFSADGKILSYTWVGLSVAKVDDALRSQLDLPADSGVVVTNVAKGSTADEAGIQVNDILLTANEKPVRRLADLLKFEKQQGKDAKVKVSLIRQGERKEVELRPNRSIYAYSPQFGWKFRRDEFQIGVNVAELQETLRSHLDLKKNEGVIVVNVIKGSPADKAGFKSHDVLLSIGEKSIGQPSDLRQAVAKSEGKQLTIKLIRGGRKRELKVTPEKLQVDRALGEFDSAFIRDPNVIRYWDVRGRPIQSRIGAPAVATWPQANVYKSGVTVEQVNQKLDRLIKQMEQLQKQMKELKEK